MPKTTKTTKDAVSKRLPNPTKKTEDFLERIITALENGISLKSVCEEQGMPNRSTVLRWFSDDADFASRCARARAVAQEVTIDDMAEMEGQLAKGLIDPQAAKVILSSRQWRAAKLAPKKYGKPEDDTSTVKLIIEGGLPD